jgi:hypothetical protein
LFLEIRPACLHPTPETAKAPILFQYIAAPDDFRGLFARILIYGGLK